MSQIVRQTEPSPESLITLVSRGVCHEISNLLTAIYGHVGLARAHLPAGHPARESLDEIENAARAAADSTRTLMLVGQTTRSAHVPIRVERLLETAGRIVRGVIPASIGLRVLPSADGLVIRGDLALLRNAILEYAIRFRELVGTGGMLTVAASRAAADSVSIELRGTRGGSEGISRDAFDAWSSKALSAESSAGQNVAVHAGSVSGAVSDGAALVRISLPTIVASDDSPGALSQDSRAGVSRGVILIAEDYDLIRGLMASTLEARGFEVLQARDGPNLLSQHAAQRDRLTHLLIDVDLPGRNGLDCLREIRAAGSHTTTVLVTGAASSDIEDMSDANTYIFRKPFQMAALAEFVSRLHVEPPRGRDGDR